MFYVSDEQKNYCLETFGQNQKSLNEDILILRDWISKQLHFPQFELSDLLLFNFLIRSKFSIEICKSKIDMYFTMRRLMPDFYKNINPTLSERQQEFKTNIAVVVPTLTKELSRIGFIKITKPNSLDLKFVMQEFVNLAELQLRENVSLNEIVIFDCANTSFDDYKKLTPSLLNHGIAVYRKVYNMRIKAIYLINCKPFMNKVMTFIKPFVKQKIFERFHYDEGIKCLQTVLTNEQIPADYGGKAEFLADVQDRSRQKFLENKDLFDSMDRLKTDESLRPEKLNNDEILGYYGNFKTLEVD